MKRLKKITTIMAVAAFAMGMMALPANAVAAPGVAECTGTATVSPGLFFPGVGPSQTFTWELATTCTVESADGVELNVPLNASGTGTGFCGQSTASGGSGTLGNVNLSNIGWTSAGSVLAVTGTHDGGATGTFAAEVEAAGGAACADAGADQFTVVIVAEFV